jgi:antitoxin MazE
MFHMKTTIRRLGNSQGVTIPRSVLTEVGFAVDCAVEMVVEGAAIVIRKASTQPREGWAEAAESIGAEPADREWLEADLDSEARSGLMW